jgi:argininosuccinate lyase
MVSAMSNILWDKGNTRLNHRIMAFCAGEDVLLDRNLIHFDIKASRAHVEGLEHIGILDEEDRDALLEELDNLTEALRQGRFELDERFEDGHSAIESWLTEKLGELGKKVHTGRSRNDQVLVASRLYLRHVLDRAWGFCSQIARVALVRAREHADTPMPGYTHLQRAVPSSVGMWFAWIAESFIDNMALLDATRERIDANPLGTAAGYGVNLALDREHTTRKLEFTRMQINPIYAQNSRGKFEMLTLQALGQAMLDVRRIAWDLSLFTTAEFAFVELPDEYTTGSSIMPNKRNPDVIELLRGSYSVIPGAIAEIEQILSLPSGYHRDLQGTKGPLMRGCQRALDAFELVPDLLEALSVNAPAMREAIDSTMYATDLAVELATSGVPFREAYRQVGASLDTLEDRSPEDSLDARTSPGACADLMLDALQARHDQLARKV